MRGAHGSLPEVDGAKPRPPPEAMQLLREAISHAHIVELLGPPLGESRQQRREAGPRRYGLLPAAPAGEGGDAATAVAAAVW